jgi:hypothetical protein
MKLKYIMIGMSLLSQQFWSAVAQTHVGTLEEEIFIAPGIIELNTISFYSSSASYTNGGITFTFPNSIFTEAPTISIAIESSNFTTSTISSRITANSATSVTITLLTDNGLLITEPASGTATVHIWAVGD